MKFPRPAKLSLALLTTVLTCAAAEVGFRVVKRARYRGVAADWDHALYAMRPDDPFVYSMHPDRSRSNEIPQTGERWTYTINSSGLRGPEPEEGTLRVLALGDSYTFGWAVDDEDAYPRLLEERLSLEGVSHAGVGDARIEVVNCGTPGFNTMQQAAYLAHVWDGVDPDVVVLGFVMNDAEPPRVVPCPPDILYGFAGIWLLEDLKRIFNARLGDPPTFTSRLFEQRPYLDQFAPGQPEREACRAALAEIAATCRAADVPLVVAVFPAFSVELDKDYAYAPIHDMVCAWGAEEGVHTIDLMPHFTGVERREYMVLGDGHPNRLAYEKFASVIAPVVLELLAR